MPGFMPGIHVLLAKKTWMAGTSPAMTMEIRSNSFDETHAAQSYDLEYQLGAAAHQSGSEVHQGGAARCSLPARDEVP
jgi:hypothetical protein